MTYSINSAIFDKSILIGTVSSSTSSYALVWDQSSNQVKYRDFLNFGGTTGSIPTLLSSGLTQSNLSLVGPTLSFGSLWSITSATSTNFKTNEFTHTTTGIWNLNSTSISNVLSINSATWSDITLRSVGGDGTAIGRINWVEGVLRYAYIDVNQSRMVQYSFLDYVLNVNGTDSFRVSYGPNVGIVAIATGVLFNIRDNAFNSNLFRITSTASTTLLNYDNLGVLENRNNIQLGLTSSGYVLKSPDGTNWKISIDNSGALITGTSI